MTHTLIIDTATLAANLDNPEWVIVDCRFDLAEPAAAESAYRRDHIPGAYYAHLDRDLSARVGPDTGRHPLPDPGTLAKRFSRWGITATRQIVAYDQGSGMFAARLWWLARWLGHPAVAVLDGGYGAWKAQGLPLTDRRPPDRDSGFQPAEQRSLWLELDEVQRMVNRGAGDRLLDARSRARYRGDEEPLDPRAGHIPGARNLPHADNTGTDGRFLAPDVLRQRFEAVLAGTTPEDVVHTCGSGVSACHNLLAMELAGLHGSRLYPGSWSEWCSDPGRPAETGDGGREP